MASGKVVGSVFFAADELLRVEELAVSPGPHLVDDSGLQVKENSPRDMLSGSGFAEKCVEGVVSTTDCFVTGHLSIRLKKTAKPRKQFIQYLKNIEKSWNFFEAKPHLNAMFKAVKLPTSIPNLDSSLPNVD